MPGPFEAAGATVRVLVSSRRTAGRYTVCEVEAPARAGVPLHSHAYEDNYFYVLAGLFDFRIGSRDVEAAPGFGLFIPKGTAFALRNRGVATGRLMVFARPGGLDLLARDLAALEGAAELGAVLDKHGIAIPSNSGEPGDV